LSVNITYVITDDKGGNEMIIIIARRKSLMGWEKKRYSETLKRLILEIQGFNKRIGVFNNDIQIEIQIKFK